MEIRNGYLSVSRMSAAALTLLVVGCSKAPADTSGSGGQAGLGGAGGATASCISSPDDLIADFTTDNGISPVLGRSGGFYVYGDPTPGVFDPPKVGDDPYPIDKTNGNVCSGPGSFHTKASGFATWGAAVGVDFVPKVGTVKGTYDASMYRGISFWARAAAPVTRVQVSFPDVYTDGLANPTAIDSTIDPCVYTAGAINNCSPYLVKLGAASGFPNYVNSQIDTTWRRFNIMFADTKQDPDNPGFHPANADHLDLVHLTGMAIQVNAIFVGATVSANNFEIWIDDVNFIR